MFAGLGKEVGGMIKEYGLNKEKQKKADARVKSALNGMPEYVQAGVLSPEQKTMAEEYLNDPNKSSAEKVAFIEEQEKRLFQLPKVLLAQSQADMAKTQARVANLTSENEIATSGLKMVAQNYINKKTKLEADLLQTQSENEKEKIRSQLDILEEQKKQLSQGNEFFKRTFEDRAAQEKLKTSGAEQALAKNALEILRLNDELNNSTDALEREKLEAQIENLRANTAKELADAGFLKSQDEQIQSALRASGAPTESTGEPVVQLDDIDEAAQGDLAGVFENLVNKFTEFFAGESLFEENVEARAQVEVLNQQLRPAFVKALSDKGSVYTQQEINKILPQTSDSNPVMRAKMKALPALLRRQVEADRKLISTGMGTETQRAVAFSNLQKLPAIAASLEQIIERDITQGEAKTEEDLLRKFDPK